MYKRQGILGGTSSLLLFLANIYVQSYQLVMYLEIILIGMLVGLEIPLLTRIIEENAGNLRITPVSYTHLDVYKRQSLTRFSRDCFLWEPHFFVYGCLTGM